MKTNNCEYPPSTRWRTSAAGSAPTIFRSEDESTTSPARSRVTCPDADLSVEPDVVFLSHATVDDGLVKLVERASEEPDRFIEIEGPPDLIVEIVSDSSVGKDTKRLPEKYFRAGVKELLLLDARKQPIKFAIHARGKRGFIRIEPDKKGFARSEVLGASYHLERRRDRKGWPLYELHEKS